MDYKNEFNSDDDFDFSNNSYNDNCNNNNNAGNICNVNSEQAVSANPNGLSKAQLRKTNKPIMEKKRRARINHCLNELKSLILEAMRKDPSRHTKLEKADILEMTVKHLQSVQRQQLNMAIQTDPTVIHKFRTGFVECAEEVNRYIGQLDGVEVSVRQRLINHLSNCANSLEQIGAMTTFNNGYRGQLGINNAATGLFASTLPNPLATTAISARNTLFPPLPQDFNKNNSNSAEHGAPIQMGAVQLIPSRLPSGEFALIMPNINTNTGEATNLLNNNNNNALPSATFASAWMQQNVTNSNVGAAVAPTAMPHNKICGNTAQISATTSNSASSAEHTSSMQRLSAFSKPQIAAQAPQQQPPLKLHNTNFNLSSNASSNTNMSLATQQPPTNSLHHSSTATTSPPLSPISSMSSHGDDSSIMQSSSDFTNSRPTTPPHDSNASQHNFSGVFNTPPSTDTSIASSHSSGSTHLQQQQVTSTSGSELSTSLTRPLVDANSATGRGTATATTMPTDLTDGSLEQPKAKRYAFDTGASDLSCARDNLALGTAGEAKEEDNMWRPW